MEMQADEYAGRLVTGLLEVVQCLTTALESTGSINRAAFIYMLQGRLEFLEQGDLQTVPMTMMLNFLDPQEPPRPVLRLLPGGKQ